MRAIWTVHKRCEGESIIEGCTVKLPEKGNLLTIILLQKKVTITKVIDHDHDNYLFNYSKQAVCCESTHLLFVRW